jgi:uncharacterized protein YjiS (DUF1127 family)
MNTISANWKDRSHQAVLNAIELDNEDRKLGSFLRTALRALWRRAATAWRYAAARREFARLDDHTLRDLGISRDEFDSYWAESIGLAERSRRRVSD